MANDDERYTLSPESIFVKSDAPKTLSVRIEEFYLGLLRLFILAALAICLVGAGTLGYQAFVAANEAAQPYSRPVQLSPAERFLAFVKREAADHAKLTSSTGAGVDPKAGEVKVDALEVQLNRQLVIVNDFLAQMSKGITSPAAFKDRQRTLAEELAALGAAASPSAYARSQADFLDRVLRDKSLAEQVRLRVEQSPAYLDEFMNKMLDYYPNGVRDERQARAAFEREEAERVAAVRANSMLQIYAAVGLFVGFLVISLILVLIKIERNLRTRGDIIQVVA